MLLRVTDRGLYCEAGDFYIDPWQPVDRAVITHAHGDHARWGSRHYLASAEGRRVLRTRLGADASIQSLEFRESLDSERRARLAPPRRTYSRLGTNSRRASAARCGSSRAITRPTRIRRARRSRSSVPHVHHRVDLRPADLPLAPAGRSVRRDARAGGAATPKRDVRRSSTPTRSARRSGCSRGCATRRSARSTRTARSSGSRATTASRGSRCPHAPRERASARARLRRSADRRAAVRRREHVAAPLRRRVAGVRVGVDADPRRTPPARGRSRLRAVRSRRLAGAARHDRGHRRRARVGDAWLSRAGGAMAAGARHRCAERRQPLGGRGGGRVAGCRRGDRRVRRFAQLFAEIDRTTRTTEKVEAMTAYFARSGCRRRGVGRLLPVRRAAQAARAGATALVVGDGDRRDSGVAVRRVLRRRGRPGGDDLAAAAAGAAQRASVRCTCGSRSACSRSRSNRRRRSARASVESWSELDGVERFVWNKLITGGFRVGVSHQLVVRALSRASGIDEGTIAHRLTGHWEPTADAYRALVAAGHERRRSLAPVSVLPRVRARGIARGAGRCARVAGRVEVGRHSRAAHSSRRERRISGRAATSW